jgi:hypothetical protein
MIASKVEFVLFYTVFILFVIQVSGMAGQTIFGDSPQFANVPTDATTILNPLTNFGFWVSLLTLSTEYQLLFSLLILPLIVGLVWVFVEMVRGV